MFSCLPSLLFPDLFVSFLWCLIFSLSLFTTLFSPNSCFWSPIVITPYLLSLLKPTFSLIFHLPLLASPFPFSHCSYPSSPHFWSPSLPILVPINFFSLCFHRCSSFALFPSPHTFLCPFSWVPAKSQTTKWWGAGGEYTVHLHEVWSKLLG